MALLGIFRKQADRHPLADPKAAATALAALAREEPEQAIGEVNTWLESLLVAEGLSLQRCYELTLALDEAGASSIRR